MTVCEYDAVEGFAGPGGWDLAARDLGLNVLGIEIDPAACATRRAANLPTLQADVRTLDPLDPRFDAPGKIDSPVCTTFSLAGKGTGRADTARIIAAVRALDHTATFADERTDLVLEPLRWHLARHHAGRPYQWIAMEQVPQVLPIWEAYADVLRELGYGVATAVLSSEMYGVAQTRDRAILIARHGRSVSMPAPTHSRYYPHDPKRLDPGVAPWVSMAQALGWGMAARPSMTVTGGGTGSGGPEPFGTGARAGIERERGGAGGWTVISNYGSGGDSRNRGRRTADQPSATVTSKFDRAKIVKTGSGLCDPDTQ